MKINNINSNLIYLIPSILAILQEYYISSLIYFTMFIVSSKYHIWIIKEEKIIRDI